MNQCDTPILTTSGSHAFIGKLPQLQNLVKRDPDAYYDEFLMQYRHYESELQIFQLQPRKNSEHFGALVNFLSHVSPCYPKDIAGFPSQIVDLLRKNYEILDRSLRKILVQSLILMRNRNVIDSLSVINLFFDLFRCNDKILRELLYSHIISDLSNLTRRGHSPEMKRNLQKYLYSMIGSEDKLKSKYSLNVLVELYRRRIWCDARLVNVVSLACSARNSEIRVTAIKFFLDTEKDIVDDEEHAKSTERHTVDVNYHQHSKKTRKRFRHTRNLLLKNKRRRSFNKENALFPSIMLLNDPQGISEAQYHLLKNGVAGNERFEVKLLMFDFMSRVIGCHKLVVLNFYSLIQKYLNSHQLNVTRILAYLIQACHEMIPPGELVPVVQTIANNFVTERSTPQSIAIGINSLREIFSRTPLLLDEPVIEPLVSDFVMYNKFKDKGVMMAARSILNLIRQLHPSLLHRRLRGKAQAKSEVRPHPFGEFIASERVVGAELLEAAEAAGRFDKEENEDGWSITSDEEEGSDDNWVDIPQSDDENALNIKKCNEIPSEIDEAADINSAQLPLEARRILTPLDFQRIELLKKETAYNGAKILGNRRNQFTSDSSKNELVITQDTLENFCKKKKQTQEERLLSVLKGREEFVHRRARGGTTNKEKERSKHFLMLRKSRSVQEKARKSARALQNKRNKAVKTVLKHDKKKRRRL